MDRLMPTRPILCAIALAIASTASAASTDKVRADAESAFVAARFEQADRGYAAILARAARDTLALIRRGQIALFANRLTEARPLIEQARAAGAAPIRAAALLGEIAYRQDDYAAAAAQFKVAERVAKSAKLASFAPAKPWRIEGPDSVAIPMLQVDPLPLVSMTLNGRGPYYFLIDTGGGELAVDPALADTLGLERYGDEMGTFAGGKRSSVTHSRLDSLRLGPLAVHGVPVTLLDTKRFAPIALGRPVAGVIGTVFLYHFRATLDYPHARLVLTRRGSHTRPAGQIEIPFWMAGDHFMVAAGTLDSSGTKTWFVDTGMAGPAFTAPLSTLLDAGIPLPDTGSARTGIGGGGPVRAAPFRVRRLTLGGAEASDLLGIFGAFPPSLERGMGFQIDGLVSHGFLRAWSVTFDYDRMRLVLAKPA
jgi:predicted aspartyl protease